MFSQVHPQMLPEKYATNNESVHAIETRELETVSQGFEGENGVNLQAMCLLHACSYVS